LNRAAKALPSTATTRGETLMFDDDKPLRKTRTHEVGMAIDSMSVDELNERIALLRGEIARLEAAVESRQDSRQQADSIFKL
jgi:uncharacterized small protein (DUF1192 family)